MLRIPCETVADTGGESRERGEVFTRPWVVDLILDLAGYTSAQDLGTSVAVEPACGEGAFLGPMIDRLIESCSAHGRALSDLEVAIQAFDLSLTNVERSRKLAATRLVDAGLKHDAAERMAALWVRHDDFLLGDLAEASVDYVLGNPPYIRLESVPTAITSAYRAACPTMRGRSDVFVGFIERGLRLLRRDGSLGFIVADRWMHNDYGSALRQMVAGEFSVEAVVEMHEVDVFEDPVSAYPAVTIIRRKPQREAVLASAGARFGSTDTGRLVSWAASKSRTLTTQTVEASRLPQWFPGDELWPSGSPAQLAVIKDLEARFPTLEQSAVATRVGIGVATGADSVFITGESDLVERDRLLPLAMASDTTGGSIEWSGSRLVNPWDERGLVDLNQFPRLSKYLRSHEARLRNRHVGRHQPHAWYRTIDRVDPQLLSRPKLLLPDIKATSSPVLDDGHFYPHHNLYFIVSQGWDLEALGGLLTSRVADLFVGAYCVKMRGGSFRFQAQYLRRIRVPKPSAINSRQRRALIRAFHEQDQEAATATARQLYGLDHLP